MQFTTELSILRTRLYHSTKPPYLENYDRNQTTVLCQPHLDGKGIEVVEDDMVRLGEQGGVLKVRKILVEDGLLEKRRKMGREA